MHKLHNTFTARKVGHLSVLTLIAVFTSNGAMADSSQASQTVKIQQCKNNLTIAQSLDRSIRNNALQDQGWRTFEGNASYDVERVVLITKGTELRYRWRVAADGSIKPVNQPAEQLCDIG